MAVLLELDEVTVTVSPVPDRARLDGGDARAGRVHLVQVFVDEAYGCAVHDASPKGRCELRPDLLAQVRALYLLFPPGKFCVASYPNAYPNQPRSGTVRERSSGP